MDHSTLPPTQRAALADLATRPLNRCRGGFTAGGAVHTVRCVKALERNDLVVFSEDRRVIHLKAKPGSKPSAAAAREGARA
jgi:hypothetical protein